LMILQTIIKSKQTSIYSIFKEISDEL